jgi:hypothetical protein
MYLVDNDNTLPLLADSKHFQPNKSAIANSFLMGRTLHNDKPSLPYPLHSIWVAFGIAQLKIEPILEFAAPYVAKSQTDHLK